MQTNSLYITEGGNAIKGSNRIPAEMSMSIYNQAVSMLKLSYPDIECLPLGSTGRKGRGETNGDIDIGVALPWEEHTKILRLLKNSITSYYTNEGAHILSVGIHFSDCGTRFGVAQVDLMFSNNLALTAFALNSPYSADSAWKGVIRNLLFYACVHQVETQHDNEMFETGELKHQWKTIFSSIQGLVLRELDYLGVNGNALKQGKKIGDKIISDMPGDIVKIVLGPLATTADCYSAERLWEFVHSPKYSRPDRTADIEREFFDSIAKFAITKDDFLATV